jgi:short subunit fatty acids transporter
MQNLRPRTLLLVLISVVPVIVAMAFVVAVLLQRAGFGLAIWALLPFAVSMALIGGLGGVLGRAAARGARDGRRSGEDDGV